MADTPPQLGSIPQHSEMNIPTLSSTTDSTPATANGNNSVQNAKDTVSNSEVGVLMASIFCFLADHLSVTVINQLA